MPISVSIVEDNDQLRGTLARVISRAEGFKCVSHYPNAEAALAALPKDNPEVVLMDINLPGMNGVECVRQLKQVAPKIQAVMLTVYEDTDNIFAALAAGASGYLLKRTRSAELLEAIREVHQGGSPMTTHIARKVTQSFQKAGPSPQPTENLSQREQEVLCIGADLHHLSGSAPRRQQAVRGGDAGRSIGCRAHRRLQGAVLCADGQAQSARWHRSDP